MRRDADDEDGEAPVMKMAPTNDWRRNWPRRPRRRLITRLSDDGTEKRLPLPPLPLPSRKDSEDRDKSKDEAVPPAARGR